MDEFNEGVERVTAGLEKKQRIMHEDEKQRVAYHESGHALVAYSLPNTDPVHKVSIIPRGLAALGYTMQRPEDDRYLMTQGELESRIQVLLAGTMAEEMIFDDVSTGAQNDLERATEIARSMVMDFGMSRLGRVNYPRELAVAVPGRRRRCRASAATASRRPARSTRKSSGSSTTVCGERGTFWKPPRQALEALAKRLIEEGSDRHERAEADHRGEFPQPDDRARHRRGGPQTSGYLPPSLKTSTPRRWNSGPKGEVVEDLSFHQRVRSASPIDSNASHDLASSLIGQGRLVQSNWSESCSPPWMTAVQHILNSRHFLAIAVGLVLLIASTWLPEVPAVTGIALVALGATRSTIAQF